MSESFLLGGYVGVTPSRRPEWSTSAVPDPYLTISNCLADELLVPEFYGWFQDQDGALAAARDASWAAPLVAIGSAIPDAEVLLDEYADEPYYFTLLRERRPL